MATAPKPSFEMLRAAVNAGKGFKWPNEDDTNYVRLSAKDIATLRKMMSLDGYVKRYSGFDTGADSSNWSLYDEAGRNIMFTSHPLDALLGDPKKAKADASIAAAENVVRRLENDLASARRKVAALIAKHRPAKSLPAAKKTPAKKTAKKKAKL